MSLIETQDLWKTYQMGTEEVHALRGVSIQIGRGEYVAIMVVSVSSTRVSTLRQKPRLVRLASPPGSRSGGAWRSEWIRS